MGRQIAEARADIRHVVIVMMDDYVEPAGEVMRNSPPDAHYSCRRFAMEEIRDVLNAGADPEGQLPAESIWVPEPSAPADYDRWIASAGGIDLFLLASGASDGHVAFNGPPADLDSGSRLVEIGERTRVDNLETFPEFGSLDDVPTHGVTVGLATITRLSRSAALMIHGEQKRDAVRRLAACDGFDPDWPVSCAFLCPQIQVYLDRAAAGGPDV